MQLKYGDGYKEFDLPDGSDVTRLAAYEVPVIADVGQSLLHALAAPLGTSPLSCRDSPASIAIAVPDESRPTPLKKLLPPLLEHLSAAFSTLKPENITIVVGGGLHPPPDGAQLHRILPREAFACRIVSHDAVASPMTSFGTTSRGTPVEINAEYAAAQLKIVIGQIDPHQFVGFTGGSKGAAIGLASKAMIEHNHSLMSHSGALAGQIKENPVREDLNEAGAKIGIDLAINVVMDPAKRIAALLAGDPAEVLRKGAAIAGRVYGLYCPEPFDMAIASCGGHPKDMCLYQAQKGLNLASHCVREGGRILLLAACPQGVGDSRYHDYVRRFSSARMQLEDFKNHGFRMGAHKAFLFSRTITRFEVVVVSELDEQTLAQCHLTKGDLQATLDHWIAQASAPPRIAVVPNANTTFFRQKPPGEQ